MQRVLCLSLLMVCAANPGPLSGQASTRERNASWVAPAGADRRPNPLASRPEAADGGAKTYSQRCTSCHGERGEGSSKAPTLTTADVQQQTDGALFWKISSGNAHAGMPAFSMLPEPQRWQLVLHLRLLAAE